MRMQSLEHMPVNKGSASQSMHMDGEAQSAPPSSWAAAFLCSSRALARHIMAGGMCARLQRLQQRGVEGERLERAQRLEQRGQLQLRQGREQREQRLSPPQGGLHDAVAVRHDQQQVAQLHHPAARR